MTDFAKRAYDHSFRLDPIIRSLLDVDVYKHLMAQAIFLHHRHVPVTFSVTNRTKKVRLSEEIDINELCDQLDHARTLRFEPNELIWLAGNTFYGKKGMFQPEYIDYLRSYQLPSYGLKRLSDGEFELSFSGDWADVTLWEIPALAIVNELRNRHHLRQLNKFELDILYSQAKTKLWNKLQRLKQAEVTGLADFGTRRRHSFLWQEWAVEAAADQLGTGFLGTSNVLIAMKHGLEAIGTSAHELAMVMACLAHSEDELLNSLGMRNSQYKVLQMWEKTYGGNLLVMLPDTFGTTQFLKNAPPWVNGWSGMRIDSKPDPFKGGTEAIAFWIERGIDPLKRLTLFSDGLDVDSIIALKHYFDGRTRTGFGWGTLLTNDFRGCHPRGLDVLDPISIVCKVKTANGRPAVKLSDNWQKATGPADEIERYRKIFGTAGIDNLPVVV